MYLAPYLLFTHEYVTQKNNNTDNRDQCQYWYYLVKKKMMRQLFKLDHHLMLENNILAKLIVVPLKCGYY